MSLKIIKDFKQLSVIDWQKFVFDTYGGSIFHLPELFNLYNLDKNLGAIFLAVVDSENRILGVLIAYNYKEFSGLLGSLSSRIISWGGPLVKDCNQFYAGLLLDEFDKVSKRKAIFSQFRNLWDTNSMKGMFLKKGYKFEEHLNFHFDLTVGQEQIWRDIHSTRRKQIKRGESRGVKTLMMNNLSEFELEACYGILSNLYSSIRLPLPEIGFFKRAFSILCPGGYLKTILALYENDIIGFRMVLCYKQLMYDWYAGSSSEHYNKYPNDILPWELMKWGIENGFKTFDFGGAGKPGVQYGVRDYKEKFGGTLVNFGRYEKVHKPLMMLLGKTGFKIWKYIKN